MEFIAVALLIICGIIIYFYFIKGNHDDWIEDRQRKDIQRLKKSEDILYRKPKSSFLSTKKNNKKRSNSNKDIDPVSGAYEKTKSIFRKKKRTQLEIVNQSNYRAISLLNNEERSCFYIINDILDHSKHFLFTQVSMGEAIKPYRRFGGYVTNNKRFDFLITDKSFNPVLAIEYNGTGHFQKNWKERDKVKEIACQKAGILFFVITYDDNREKAGEEIKFLLYGK